MRGEERTEGRGASDAVECAGEEAGGEAGGESGIFTSEGGSLGEEEMRVQLLRTRRLVQLDYFSNR